VENAKNLAAGKKSVEKRWIVFGFVWFGNQSTLIATAMMNQMVG
jgi:hypothetical protein